MLEPHSPGEAALLEKGTTIFIKQAGLLFLILVANSKSGERYHKKVFFLFSVGNINHL